MLFLEEFQTTYYNLNKHLESTCILHVLKWFWIKQRQNKNVTLHY